MCDVVVVEGPPNTAKSQPACAPQAPQAALFVLVLVGSVHIPVLYEWAQGERLVRRLK